MALNRVILQGNLCKDNVINNNVLRNTLAVSRNFVKEGEERQIDFISIVSFGKQAEFIDKFFSKGSPILIEGRLQTGSYDNAEGKKIYTMDVIVEGVNFVAKKETSENNVEVNVVDTDDSSLPF